MIWKCNTLVVVSIKWCANYIRIFLSLVFAFKLFCGLYWRLPNFFRFRIFLEKCALLEGTGWDKNCWERDMLALLQLGWVDALMVWVRSCLLSRAGCVLTVFSWCAVFMGKEELLREGLRKTSSSSLQLRLGIKGGASEYINVLFLITGDWVFTAWGSPWLACLPGAYIAPVCKLCILSERARIWSEACCLCGLVMA